MSTPATFRANSTRQMNHPEESMDPTTVYSPKSLFPLNSNHSLSTTMPPLQKQRSIKEMLVTAISTQLNCLDNNEILTASKRGDGSNERPSKSYTSPIPGEGIERTEDTTTNPRWPAPLPTQSSGRPRPYPNHLQPQPSTLRPHCPSKDRLVLWQPTSTRTFRDREGRPIELREEDLERVKLALVRSYAENTLQSYSTWLLVFHIFCDTRSIPEDQRAPASSDLISNWLAAIVGTYSGTAIRNYLAGVRAWHIIHGLEWKMNKPEVDALLWSAEKNQPTRSQQKKRKPWTTAFITTILEHLNPQNPQDAAIAACLTTTFYSCARLGEFTVPNLNSFKAGQHVTRVDIRQGEDRNGFRTTIFHIPRTKTEPVNGEDVYWSAQEGPTNPQTFLVNHLTVNDPPNDSHLFSFKHTTSGQRSANLRPLTKHAFLTRISNIAKERRLEMMQGHGIRIGSTMEYLLRGVPFEAVKVMGRWKSDAFLVYLRRHAEIMAPYMQPALHQDFIRYTMPPPRRG